MKIIAGGVTKPLGFRANGLFCGIKRSGQLDLGLLISDKPGNGAAVFTRNSIKAAPLKVSERHIRKNKVQAMIVNSGNANCFTGQFGLTYAENTTEIIGKLLNIPQKTILVASTGIIGRPLPYKKIANAAPHLVKGLNAQGGEKFAQAILTTDLKLKEIAVQFPLSGKKVTIGGCCKGSGMIAPNMATMLGFITTDAAIHPGLLKSALKKVTAETFNCITIDDCMSTNDMVAMMANGLAGNKEITSRDENFKKFYTALHYVCLDLAKKIVLDGEGATKFITVKITGARTSPQAKTIALKIANSNLVKTAAFGSNPNWGRVAAAAGSLGVKSITEENLKINFSPFNKRDIEIHVDLNIGPGESTVYTCDLSYEYIRINGEYN